MGENLLLQFLVFELRTPVTVEANILSSLIVFYNWFCKRATIEAVFPCQPNLPPQPRPDSIKLLTTFMTEICGWRAFPTARTVKHFRKFVRIVSQAKNTANNTANNSFPLKNIKTLIPTPPSFSARAYFWCFSRQQHSFNLQQLVLKICSNYFKFGATLFNLQHLYLICSDFILFAATFFNLQNAPCGPPYNCNSIVGFNICFNIHSILLNAVGRLLNDVERWDEQTVSTFHSTKLSEWHGN